MPLVDERAAEDEDVRTLGRDVSQKILERLVVEVGAAREGSAGDDDVQTLRRTAQPDLGRRRGGARVAPNFCGHEFAAVRIRRLGQNDLPGKERVVAHGGGVQRQRAASADVLRKKKPVMLEPNFWPQL